MAKVRVCEICHREFEQRGPRRPFTCGWECKMERDARKKREQYHAAKEAGLCPGCGAPAAEGLVNCETCNTAENERGRERRKRRRDRLAS